MIKTILIIEDDKDMCAELNEALSGEDFKIRTAYSGLSGKKLIDKNSFDVIILDLKLPDLDGYQILNYLNKNKIKSKVIVITARMKIHFEDIIDRDQDKKEELILKKADYVLLKPFKISKLAEIINNI